jgi:hypothetical protein
MMFCCAYSLTTWPLRRPGWVHLLIAGASLLATCTPSLRFGQRATGLQQERVTGLPTLNSSEAHNFTEAPEIGSVVDGGPGERRGL